MELTRWMMMIATHSRAQRDEKRRKVNPDYGGMVQASQQHVAPCVKGVEWGLSTKGLRMMAAFWASIPVYVTQEANVVQRCRCADTGTPF